MNDADRQAIRVVLDKLVAIEGRDVEFADAFYRRTHGIEIPALTAEEVAAARQALDRL